MDNKTGIVKWKRPNPSSVLYCHPIKFIFTKESRTLVTKEKATMEKFIDKLSIFNNKENNTNHLLRNVAYNGRW